MLKKSLALAIALFGLAACSAALAIEALPPLKFGVAPQQSASNLVQLWTPLFQLLTEKTGYEFEFHTARDVDGYEKRLDVGEFDIAYMNPYHYTVVHKSVGYDVFAKEKNRRMKGIIVVQRDSPYRTLNDLHGATIAFPGPAAFAATLLPLAEFRKLGVRVSFEYVATHNSVYLSVNKGLYAAGGSIRSIFEHLDPTIGRGLRVLWESEGYTPHAIAAHPRVPTQVLEKIKHAMFELENEAAGREALNRINFNGIVPAKDAEYEDIRAIGDYIVEKSR